MVRRDVEQGFVSAGEARYLSPRRPAGGRREDALRGRPGRDGAPARRGDRVTVRVGVDTGGTFTDLVAVDEAGGLVLSKCPSTPSEPVGAVLDALFARDWTSPPCRSSSSSAPRSRRTRSCSAPAGACSTSPPLASRTCRSSSGSTASTSTTSAGSKPVPLLPAARTRLVSRSGSMRDGAMLASLTAALLNGLAGRRRRRGSPRRRLAPGTAIAVNFLCRLANPEHELRAGGPRGALPGVPCPCHPSRPSGASTSAAPRRRGRLPQAAVGPSRGRSPEPAHAGLAPLKLMKSNGGRAMPGPPPSGPSRLLLSGLAGGLIAARYYGGSRRDARNQPGHGHTSADVGVVPDGEGSATTTEYQVEWGVPIDGPRSIDLDDDRRRRGLDRLDRPGRLPRMSTSKRSRSPRDAGASVTAVVAQGEWLIRLGSKRARRRSRAPIRSGQTTRSRRFAASLGRTKWASCSKSSPSIRPTGRRRRVSNEPPPRHRPPTCRPSTCANFPAELLRHLRPSLPLRRTWRSSSPNSRRRSVGGGI